MPSCSVPTLARILLAVWVVGQQQNTSGIALKLVVNGVARTMHRCFTRICKARCMKWQDDVAHVMLLIEILMLAWQWKLSEGRIGRR